MLVHHLNAPSGGASAISGKLLFGGYDSVGISFEWHEFETALDLDWAQFFQPDSVELCLNILGGGIIGAGSDEAAITNECVGFYRHGATPLRGSRKKGRHQFITVKYSREFLCRHFKEGTGGLHPIIQQVVTGKSRRSAVAAPLRLGTEHAQLSRALQRPPVYAGAQAKWFESKALELAASFFFIPDNEHELFCDRQRRLARERCEQVLALLRADLAHPPALEELGKKVGCSHFHLSRTFSKEMGSTIPQYLRKLRMEKAAELLKSGKFNVTEAALEVGYASPSHFSQAFHETFGCCPGLYGIAPDHNQR